MTVSFTLLLAHMQNRLCYDYDDDDGAEDEEDPAVVLLITVLTISQASPESATL